MLIVQYCCDDPKKAVEECDYACGKRSRKLGMLSVNLTEELEPIADAG
jgi:hypothetical protein